MLVALPIWLPDEENLLLSHDQRLHPLQTERNLYLVVWPISGKHTKHRAFHNDQRLYPLQTERILYLVIWPISGKHTKHRAFHRELQSLSLVRGTETQMQIYWCTRWGFNPFSTSLVNIMEFLTDRTHRFAVPYHKYLKVSHFNDTSRYWWLTCGKPPLVFKGMFNTRSTTPRFTAS